MKHDTSTDALCKLRFTI